MSLPYPVPSRSTQNPKVQGDATASETIDEAVSRSLPCRDTERAVKSLSRLELHAKRQAGGLTQTKDDCNHRRSPKRYRALYKEREEEEPSNRKRRCLGKPMTPRHMEKLKPTLGADFQADNSPVLGSPVIPLPVKRCVPPSTGRRDVVKSIMESTVTESGRLVPALPQYYEFVCRIPPSFSSRSSSSDAKKGHVQLNNSQVAYLMAKMLPVELAKSMSTTHLLESYRQCIDTGPTVERNERMNMQIDPHTATRKSLIKWMSDVCSKMKWTVPSCYGAISALDTYVSSTQHRITLSNLPKIAATCLYYSSQMQETAVDECIISVDRFLNICPEVGATSDFMDKQVHLVDTLQGANYTRKTPFDFTLLFLARLQTSAGLLGEYLYRYILYLGHLPTIIDAMHSANLYFYYCSGLAQWLSPHIWVFCGLHHIISYTLLQKPSASDEFLSLAGMSDQVLMVLDKFEKEHALKNLLSVILSDTAHLGRERQEHEGNSPSFPPHPIRESPQSCLSTNCTSNGLSESAIRQLIDDETSNEGFLAEDAGKPFAPPKLEQTPAPRSGLMDVEEGRLINEALQITEPLFVKCTQLVMSTTITSAPLRGDHSTKRLTELPASCIMNLKWIRKEKSRNAAGGHHKSRLHRAGDPTIDCIRPAAFWIHIHPDRIFGELESQLKREALIAIKRCRESSFLLLPTDHGPRLPSPVQADGVPSGSHTRRRESVCAGMDMENVHPKKGRASIQAPVRRPNT